MLFFNSKEISDLKKVESSVKTDLLTESFKGRGVKKSYVILRAGGWEGEGGCNF